MTFKRIFGKYDGRAGFAPSINAKARVLCLNKQILLDMHAEDFEFVDFYFDENSSEIGLRFLMQPTDEKSFKRHQGSADQKNRPSSVSAAPILCALDIQTINPETYRVPYTIRDGMAIFDGKLLKAKLDSTMKRIETTEEKRAGLKKRAHAKSVSRYGNGRDVRR